LIQDCPTNKDALYDPYKKSGVPIGQVWKQNGINS
jgi:hypothetical protein